MSGHDRTALSFWFPKIEAAGLPVPRTKIFKMPTDAQEVILNAFDGKTDNGTALIDFARWVAAEAAELGFPLFLRTDHTSGKHGWRDTCFVPGPDALPKHMFGIAEYSELASIMGMPWDTWVAREMLPTIPFGVCPHYGDMPICREFRFFVDGDEIICQHPYWPANALERGGVRLNAHDFHKLSTVRDTGEMQVVSDLARRAGAACGGAWSVDILETKRGWFVTDMAEAHKSFHWPDCPQEERARRAPT
jgi:hypothetical protein